YDFQRDSLYSGLATRNIRNIDALRTQMSLATGGAPTFDSGGLFSQRAGSGASVADLGAGRPQVSIDPFSTRIGSLRSTASYIGAGSVEPQFFGTTQDQSGQPYAIGSSPLRGVIAQPLLVNPEGPQAALPQLPGTATLPSAASAQAAAQPTQPAAQPGQGLTFNPADLARADEPASQRPGQVNQTPTSNRVV